MSAEKDADELAAIERAAYAGSPTRNPEADVRVLLRLLKGHRALVETLADEWEAMADSTSVHGLRDAFRACATDLRGALTRVTRPEVGQR